MDTDPLQQRLGKTALFCVLLLLHAGFFLLALRSTIPLPESADLTALQLLILPLPAVAPAKTSSAPAATLQRRTPVAKIPAPLQPVQPQPPGPSPPESAAMIDWTQQAQTVVHDQAELEAVPGPRPLDARARRQAAANSPAKPAPEFAWDQVHTHRVQSSDGVLVIRLNDRCALVLLPLPLLGCGFGGEIPVRGDLFDHMRDAPVLGAPAP